MRPVALGRKNWLHVGSAKSGPKIAAILSVVESCRRLRVPVKEYLLADTPKWLEYWQRWPKCNRRLSDDGVNGPIGRSRGRKSGSPVHSSIQHRQYPHRRFCLRDPGTRSHPHPLGNQLH
jgi:hypothetical protein